MSATVFYSWQSDHKAALCRTFIQRALEAAVRQIVADGVVDAVVDRDTFGVAGAPDIGATILSKIDAADAFVADVTLINQLTVGSRVTPNPNVLIELGYALKALGPARLILVQNVDFGGPELLPFDLRQRRVLPFQCPEDATARPQHLKQLQSRLREALTAILLAPRTSAAVKISIDSKAQAGSTGSVHYYTCLVAITNQGQKRWDDWEVEITFPTPVLDPDTTHGIRVADRSNARHSVLRVVGHDLRPIRPGETRPIPFGFIMNDKLYERRSELFKEIVKVRVLLDGEIAAESERSFEELQNY